MPPSGYTKTQTSHIQAFLSDCATALEFEARASNVTLMVALEGEINSIARHTRHNEMDDVARATLELTAAFYRKVHEASPTTAEEFWRVVDGVLSVISSNVLEIKIASV